MNIEFLGRVFVHLDNHYYFHQQGTNEKYLSSSIPTQVSALIVHVIASKTVKNRYLLFIHSDSLW